MNEGFFSEVLIGLRASDWRELGAGLREDSDTLRILGLKAFLPLISGKDAIMPSSLQSTELPGDIPER